MKFLALLTLIMTTSTASFALPPENNPDIQMECSIRIPADGYLPGIPQFKFEIARTTNNSGYILIKTPLRPAGAPAIEVPLNQVSVSTPSVYKTADGIEVDFSNQGSDQASALIAASGLVFDCTQPCASGHYDAQANSCVFPSSLVPVP